MFGRSKGHAGLCIEDQVVRFLELSGEPDKLSLVNKVEVPLPPDAVKQDAISNVQVLEGALSSLKTRLGNKVPSNITVGIPSRDVFIRIIDMPRMEIGDARNAFRWDFEKHIPFSALDAVFDVAEIDHPQNEDPEQMKILVAASKSRTIEVLSDSLRRVGLPVGSIEPINIAMFRSLTNPITPFTGGVLAIFVGQETSQFIVGYLDNGIIYRSILGGFSQPTEKFQELLVRESSSTLSFVSAQLRGVVVDKIILAGGLKEKEAFRDYLSGELSMQVDIADPWSLWGIKGAGDKPSGWDAAIGLAVRDLK